MLDKLLTELWYRVTQFLPTNVHKTCLSVLKMHHDIAQQYVFCMSSSLSDSGKATRLIFTKNQTTQMRPNRASWPSTTLTSAHQEYGGLRLPYQEVHREGLRPFRRVNLGTPDLLVARTRSFPAQLTNFHLLGALTEAVEALHNLLSFTWLGSLPKPPCEVMDALLRSSRQEVNDSFLQ